MRFIGRSDSGRYAKLIGFTIAYSGVFFLVRYLGHSVPFLSTDALIADSNGLTTLYSNIAVVFALFAAFVVVNESDRWNALRSAVKAEASSLEKLWHWSQHFPEPARRKFHESIREYLHIVIDREWKEGEEGKKDPALDALLVRMYDDVFLILQEQPELIDTTFALYTEVLDALNARLDQSVAKLPVILRNTFFFSDFLFVALSLFIGVGNDFLAYVFMITLGVLGYLIYLLVDDLDRPLEPGGWQITTTDYRDLLSRIS